MGRVSDAELERLKTEISLERLAESRGIVLRKRGDELIGLCPFHDDHSPSLVINPTKNLWHCLGACQSGGSVIDWVMKAEGVSFRHAVELLRRDAGLGNADSEVGSRLVKQSTVRKLSSVVETDADMGEQLKQVVDYYHETLKQSPEALAYLAERGIGSSEAIDHFKLGYSNRTLGYHIPLKNRNEGASIRGNLEKAGVIRKTGHELFRGSVVIPVLDETGRVVEMYGRKIKAASRYRPGTPMHLYLPGPHRGVWNIEALQSSNEIILCESLIDAMTFWCAGYRNVTASYGIEGFTNDHLEAFQQYDIERVLIAYDRDEAGEKASSSLAAELMSRGMECFRIQFPKGMDANEYALQVKPGEKSLGIAIRKAVWLGRGRGPKGEDENGRNDNGIPGLESMAAVDGAGAGDIQNDEETAPGGAVFAGGADTADSDIDTDAHSGGPGKREPDGVCEVSVESPGESIRSGYASLNRSETELSHEGRCREPDASDDRGIQSDSGTAHRYEKQEPLASPIAAHSRSVSVRAVVQNGEVTIHLGDRRWRIRGLEKCMSFDQLRVNVLVSCGEAFHVDTFDLYNARHRQGYIKQASGELSLKEDVLKKDFGKVFLKLEELQEKQINQTLNPNKDAGVTLSDKDKAAALSLLKSPDLLERILSDFEKCGVVGEETNKLVGYLSAVSRKLEKPLAVVIQSSSAAGKSSLMEAILSFLPSEEQVKYSAMTGQSLFYMGETDLKHKILAIVEEEGAERAAYALKLLQSEGELMIASTGKDPSTGRLETQEYRVEGPVMIFLTTTAIEIDEELQNRCIVLTVDEGREQTRAIHRLQRESHTLEGLWACQERADILKLHQDAQRLLRPLWVSNPYARELTFLDDRTRTRRDHEKYLTLIRSVALLHQYQRPVKSSQRGGKTKQYVEVTLEDIEIANRLSHQALGRSLDELAPQTRRLLVMLDEMVSKRSVELEMERSDYRFSRREIREYGGWSYDQVRVHLERLVNLEYVLVHRGGRGQSFVYELLFDGKVDSGKPQLMGLIDVESLKSKSTTQSLGGKNEGFGGGLGPHLAPIGASLGGEETGKKPSKINGNGHSFGKTPENAHLDGMKITPYLPSHTDTVSPLVAKSSDA
jgi:DNA primase